MRIRSISVKGMWSFDGHGVQIDELSDHNIFIGKNNSGKSNILRSLLFIQKNQVQLSSGDRFPVDDLELHKKGKAERGCSPQMLVNALPEQSDIPHILNASSSFLPNEAERDLLERTLKSGVLFGFKEFDSSSKTATPLFKFIAAPTRADYQKIETTKRDLDAQIRSWKDVTRMAQAVCISRLRDQLQFSSGWRQLENALEGGGNVIFDLYKWNGSEDTDGRDQAKFDLIESLFQELMQAPSLQLKPVHGGNKIHIRWKERHLPIKAFGDGVQHLLMIAYYLATQPESHLLIEEPETHLHPESLRTLMAVIKRVLKGQSFITTHSPVLLDTKIASQVYRIEYDGAKSAALRCKGLSDYYGILDDLGVRPSDLLQANVVIWVEGPTDRMFLKKCLALRKSPWHEGLHYLIAWYGGALLSHVTAGQEGDELVDLLRLCRKVAVVCDSDKGREEETLSPAKERIRKKVKSAGGLCWITSGREIENYFPDSVLARTYRRLLGSKDARIQLAKFDRLDKVIREQLPEPAHGKKWIWRYADNKVGLMKEILTDLQVDELDRLDLTSRLVELEQFIANANPASRPTAGNS